MGEGFAEVAIYWPSMPPSRGVRFGDDASYTGLVWRDHAAVKRVYFVQTCNQSEAARDVCVAGHDALTSF